MKIAIMETITTPGGHEVDFDRILVDEFRAQGHEVTFFVPEGVQLPLNYGVPIREMPGKGITYTGLRGIKKLWASAKREFRRQKWYRYMAGQTPEWDAIIVPTSTYRYLRALRWSPLKYSPIPVIFILHGINPGEAEKFIQAAKALIPYDNIHMAVLTFGETIFGQKPKNVTCMVPPTYLPRDIAYQPANAISERLKLGFFGQYRREKQLEAFLDMYLSQTYAYPVELMVQGATMRPEDTEDFDRIIRKYQGTPGIQFLHKGLIGREWQEAIAGVDALLLPYSAPRYRYHWGGMLFTALGYQKPVIVSDDMNPEVMEQYTVGTSFASGDQQALKQAIKTFIDTYPQKYLQYRQSLAQAYTDFHPHRFAEQLLSLVQK